MPEDEKNPQEQPAQERDAGQYVDYQFPTFYTNTVSIMHTSLDFSLLIGDRLTPEAVTLRARIVMTPAHAKMLVKALVRQIDAYESRFGEIHLPVLRDAPTPESSSEPAQQP